MGREKHRVLGRDLVHVVDHHHGGGEDRRLVSDCIWLRMSDSFLEAVSVQKGTWG